MPRTSPGLVLGGVAVLDSASLLMLLASRSAAATALAAVVHAGLTAAAWLVLAPGSRRELAIAWIFSLPGVGALVALSGIGLRGEGDLRQFDRGAARPRPVAPRALAQMAAAQVPICERLVAGVAQERRAALDALVTRRDADAIEILRWAVRQPDGELALEAALALEELAAGFEARRAEARQALAAAPSAVLAVAAGDVLLDAIVVGLIEPELVPTLAAEARGHYLRAGELAAPTVDPHLTERRARLELSALRPAAALEILEPVVHGELATPVLTSLYNDALSASRRSRGSTWEVRDAAARA